MIRRATLVRLPAAAAIALAVLAAVDFVRFVTTLADHPPGTMGTADGIVVLTGGAERIAQAFDLLAGGRARRLLVTGVNQATRAQDLAAARPDPSAGRDLVRCCVDLDRNALNTLGNALETARWARQNRFGSLIVVTASYHMPRTLMELRRALPDVRLVPYPVVPDGLNLGAWWHDPQTVRLLAYEYAKYAVASFRLRLDRPTTHRVKVPATSPAPVLEGSSRTEAAGQPAASLRPPVGAPLEPPPGPPIQPQLGSAPSIAY